MVGALDKIAKDENEAQYDIVKNANGNDIKVILYTDLATVKYSKDFYSHTIFSSNKGFKLFS